MSVEIDIAIHAGDWAATFGEDLDGLITAAARAALIAGAHDGAPGEIAIALMDDAEIAALNAEWRGQSGPTNVLSFALAHDAEPMPGAVAALGDVAIALETVLREAAETGKAPADHLAHLTAHGVLHLLGYDHEEDGEAAVMEAAERQAMRALGRPDPYTEAA